MDNDSLVDLTTGKIGFFFFFLQSFIKNIPGLKIYRDSQIQIPLLEVLAFSVHSLRT